MFKPSLLLSSFVKCKYFRSDIVFISLLTFILFFFNIWSGSLRDWDEAIYAQVAKEYYHSGDWLTPTLNGELWFHKPPFVMWFMALNYSIWGVGEWSARLGSAIAGVATLFITYKFVREFIGKSTAFLTALILLGIPHFVSHSKMGMIDTPLTLFILLSLYFYFKGLSEKRWFLAAGAAFGIGFMVKGVAICVVPVTILMHMAFHRNIKPFYSTYFWGGIGIAIIIFTPWHILQSFRYGSTFWNEYFIYHIVSRGTSAIEGHPDSIFYYFWVLIKEARPWFLPGFAAVPFCALFAWKEQNRFISLVVCWVIAVFTVTSIFSTKIDWYIMPIYPAFSICIAIMLLRFINETHFNKIVIGALLIIVLNGIFCHRIFDLDYSQSVKLLANNIKQEVPPDKNLYLYKLNGPSAKFYNDDRNIILLSVNDNSKFNSQINNNEHIYVLTRKDYVEELQALTFAKETKIVSLHDKYILAMFSGIGDIIKQ